MFTQKNPIVSVVVPMYNVSRYIDACIESILNQTFNNFEVICVNDGCTDNTLAKLSKYTDPRITVVHQKNAGLSAARNTGIFAAKGLYVAFLDSDDYWDKNKLARHVKHLASKSTVDVSYCPSLFVNEYGESMGIGQFPKLHNVTLRDVMCRNPIGNGSAPVIKRSILLQHVRFNYALSKKEIFNESLRQSEDIELWLRIALSSPQGFEGIPEPLTYYRVNDSGLSANTEKQFRSWHTAIWQVAKAHRKTRALFSLAKAYQLRYLARRAIQSGDKWKALRLVNQALFCNPKILVQEPNRTCITYGCALLRLLPKAVYQKLESHGRHFLSVLQHKEITV